MSFDVFDRYRTAALAQQTLRLYALVDGLQYEEFTGKRISFENGRNRALFEGTDDSPLAHAGPWVFDTQFSEGDLHTLIELERAKPAVSWLMVQMDLEGLALLLQFKLEAEVPDGKRALLRFYDPRVLFNIFQAMTLEQRAEFFAHIDEWHFLHMGKRMWTGRTDA